MFSKLPFELMSLITEYLSLADILELRGVSLHLYNTTRATDPPRFRAYNSIYEYIAAIPLIAAKFTSSFPSIIPHSPYLVQRMTRTSHREDGLVIRVKANDIGDEINNKGIGLIRVLCVVDDCYGGFRIKAISKFTTRFSQLQDGVAGFLGLEPGAGSINYISNALMTSKTRGVGESDANAKTRDIVESCLNHRSVTAQLEAGRSISAMIEGIIGLPVNINDTSSSGALSFLLHDPFAISEPPHDAVLSPLINNSTGIPTGAVLEGVERGETCVNIVEDRFDLPITELRIASYLKMISKRWTGLYIKNT